MISYDNLSKGERLFINRTRLQLSKRKYARLYNHTVSDLIDWEQNRNQINCPQVIIHQYISKQEIKVISKRRIEYPYLEELGNKMANHHGTLVDEAKTAIEKVNRDTSVSQTQTIESLEELIEECEIKINAIKEDLVIP